MTAGLNAYAAADIAAPIDLLIACGDVNLKRREFHEASEAYVKAGPTGIDKLVLLGEQCLEAGQLFLARKAYTAAGRDMPNEKLLVCAERCLADRQVGSAVEAYAAADVEVPTERLIALGDRWLEEGKGHHEVVNAYKGAGATEKLLALGDRWLAEGEISSARMAYREAGAMEKVIEIGDRLYDERNYEGALNAYSESGALKKINWGRLRAIADHLLGAGRKRSAVQAYEAVNDTEMLLMLGKRWLERNEPLDAKYAFSAVARIQLGVEHVLGGPVKERYAREPRKRRHG